MVASRRRVEHQRGMASLPQAPPDPVRRSRSPGRNHRRSSASAGGGGPPGSRRRCHATSTRPASGGWPSAPRSSSPGSSSSLTGTRHLFDVADTRVLQAIADLRTPWLTRVAKVAGVLGTATAHLRPLAGQPGRAGRSPPVAAPVRLGRRRPRRGQHRRHAWPARCSGRGPTRSRSSARWAGFSMPSLPMTVLAAFLVSTVYSLVPAGRYRTIGKWVVGGAAADHRAVPALPRAGPPDRHRRRGDPRRRRPAGRLPAADPQRRLSRCATRRGRPAHLDVTGAARRRHHPGAAGPARADRRAR